jgi:hypothetical protein
MGKFSQLYARFRISPAFLLILLAFTVASISFHLVLGYDEDWTITNLVLSLEASLSVCIFMRDSANFEKYVRDQQQMHADNLQNISTIILTGQEQIKLTNQLVERPMYTRVVRRLVMLQTWAWEKLMGLESSSPPDPDEEQLSLTGNSIPTVSRLPRKTNSVRGLYREPQRKDPRHEWKHQQWRLYVLWR